MKTKENTLSVEQFLNSVDNDQKKADCHTLIDIMKSITKSDPKMWGTSIIGFGNYHYKYDSGREGDWFITGFSPRKQNLSIYIMSGFKRYDELMDQLGKFKTGKSCLYIKKLEDVDLKILTDLITQSVKYMTKKYPNT